MFKKWKEFSKKHFAVSVLSGFTIALVLFGLMAAKLIHMLSFLNQDVVGCIVLAITLVFVFILVYYCFFNIHKDKEARQKLKQRKLSDYVKKHQYYVNLVSKISAREEYKAIVIEEDWVQLFDTCLTKLARHRQSTSFYFCDFDVASCLMYTLDSKCTGEKLSEFLLDCIKPIISEPKIYDTEFILGGELVLQERERYEKASLDIPAPSLAKDTIIVLIETYLSMSPCLYSFFRLSDFLNILYIKSCKS